MIVCVPSCVLGPQVPPGATGWGGGSPVNPVRSGLIVELLPQSLTGANGSSIASWLNTGSNGNNPANATTAAQPLVLAGAVNGYKAAVFDGVTSCLSCPISGSGTGITVFLVLANAQTTGNRSITLLGAGQASDFNNNAGILITGPLSGHKFAEVHSSTEYDSATTLPTTGPVVIGARVSVHGAMKLYVNNQSPTSLTAAELSLNLGTLLLGCGWGGVANNFSAVKLAEVGVWNCSLSDTEVTQVVTYLGTKFGLY